MSNILKYFTLLSLFVWAQSLPQFTTKFPLYNSEIEEISPIQNFRAEILKAKKLLNTLELNVVTIERPPFSFVINGTEFDGVIFHFLRSLQTKYNFSMKIRLPPDGNWGSKERNGSWNGLVGLIHRNESDLGAAALSVTYDRIQAVDFSGPFHEEATGILIPGPTEGQKLTMLIRPWSKKVWIIFGIMLLVMGPAMYLCHTLSLLMFGEKIKGNNVRNMVDVYWFIIGSILQESVKLPHNKGGVSRFLIAIWWVSGLVLANTYIGILTSNMTVPRLKNSIQSLKDLSEQDFIKWTFRQNSALQTLFQSETSSGVFKAIGDGISDTDIVATDNEGVEKVIAGTHAFIKEKSFLDVAIGNDLAATKKCRITIAKETFYTVGFALAFQKNSFMQPVFNYEISHALSTGLMEKLKIIYWPKNLACRDAVNYIISTQSKTRKLNSRDVQGALIIYLCGAFVAVFAIFLECTLAAVKSWCIKHFFGVYLQ